MKLFKVLMDPDGRRQHIIGIFCFMFICSFGTYLYIHYYPLFFIYSFISVPDEFVLSLILMIPFQMIILFAGCCITAMIVMGIRFLIKRPAPFLVVLYNWTWNCMVLHIIALFLSISGY